VLVAGEETTLAFLHLYSVHLKSHDASCCSTNTQAANRQLLAPYRPRERLIRLKFRPGGCSHHSLGRRLVGALGSLDRVARTYFYWFKFRKYIEDFGFWILDFGFWVSGLGFWV
jgi:hypothetical protein